MASKKSTKTAKNNYGDYKFINISLSAENAAELDSLDLESVFPLERICGLAETGYKFSLSFDPRNDTFTATLTDTDQESTTYQHMLTGRGSSAFDAWIALAYKHFYVAKEDWSDLVMESGNTRSRFR